MFVVGEYYNKVNKTLKLKISLVKKAMEVICRYLEISFGYDDSQNFFCAILI